MTASPAPGAAEPGTTLREREVAAWLSLLDEADGVSQRIALAVFEKDADLFARWGPELRLEVLGDVREHTRLGIKALAGQEEAIYASLETWRATGRVRARQGIGMERVLNAYTLGARFLWEALAERRASEELDDEVVLVGGQHLWASLDLMNSVFIEAYRRESALLQRRDLQRQQSTLDALVEGRGADPAFAAEAREVLGVSAELRVACVVAPYDGSLDEPLTPPVERLGRRGITSHWHVRGGLWFGLLAGELGDDSSLATLLQPYAVGRAAAAVSSDGVAGFAAAFQLASRAADTVPRGTRQVVAVSQRLPELLLAGSPEVAALLAQETVAPLLAQPAPVAEVLHATLVALLEHHGSAKRAAEALFCHRNTVIYRARQIEELTGRRFADPRDRLLLSLGVLTTPAWP